MESSGDWVVAQSPDFYFAFHRHPLSPGFFPVIICLRKPYIFVYLDASQIQVPAKKLSTKKALAAGQDARNQSS
jgi:hypothetical protein